MSCVEALDDIAKEFRLCYQCGMCSSGCPVFRVDSRQNPRQLIQKLLLGDFDEVLDVESPIWYCCMCLTCSQRCPQAVDLPHLFIYIKNLAVRNGQVPEGLLREVTTLLNTGITTNISKAVKKQREKWGLPECTPAPMDEIRKLLDLTGFSALVKQASSTFKTNSLNSGK